MLRRFKPLAQKILSVPAVRNTQGAVTETATLLFSRSYLLSVPYSWVNFLGFMREQRAVMAGKSAYYRGLRTPGRTNPLLRRNVHRLEKGLLMRPRRDTFAEDYITETVETYLKMEGQHCAQASAIDENELTWANNVLAEYFKVVQDTKTIMKARTRFATRRFRPEVTDSVPYRRPADATLPTFEQLHSLSLHRRSVRWFVDKPVERELIDKALLVARQSPSACNRLPYEFRIFDEPELVKEVSNLPFGTTGYADNIPVVAVLVGKLGSYFSSRDRHAIYVDTSLAAMGFALALETLGLSSCMINWPDFEPLERKMAKTLGLSLSERPVMLMAIGYADPEALVAKSEKKDLDTIRSYNRK